jgi:YHS domain-containing protein
MFTRSTLTARRAVGGIVFVAVVALAIAGYFNFVGGGRTSVPQVNMDADQVAIRGYDAVAYFTDGKATKGKGEFRNTWHGAHWLFASAAHRDLFAADPERYAPRYGGYCSLALALGAYSDADPEEWTIADGKLYLNLSEAVRDTWRKKREAYIVASEQNWNNHRDQLRIDANLR